MDFYSIGEFFASGSLDTNLKIWDIRLKGFIHTYKGHSPGVNSIKFSLDGHWVVLGGEDNGVNSIKFSPDGHWIVSSGEDNIVKVCSDFS